MRLLHIRCCFSEHVVNVRRLLQLQMEIKLYLLTLTGPLMLSIMKRKPVLLPVILQNTGKNVIWSAMTTIFSTLIIPSNLETSQWPRVINNYLYTLTSQLTFENDRKNKEKTVLQCDTLEQRPWKNEPRDRATLPPAAKAQSFMEEESFSACSSWEGYATMAEQRLVSSAAHLTI